MQANPIEQLVQQILAMAWIRCVMEEGVDFVNKKTGKPETNEKVIFEAFQTNTGLFDLPNAKGSKYGLEKNILEVIGGFLLEASSPTMQQMLTSNTFRSKIREKLKEIADRS